MPKFKLGLGALALTGLVLAAAETEDANPQPEAETQTQPTPEPEVEPAPNGHPSYRGKLPFLSVPKAKDRILARSSKKTEEVGESLAHVLKKFNDFSIDFNENEPYKTDHFLTKYKPITGDHNQENWIPSMPEALAEPESGIYNSFGSPVNIDIYENDDKSLDHLPSHNTKNPFADEDIQHLHSPYHPIPKPVPEAIFSRNDYRHARFTSNLETLTNMTQSFFVKYRSEGKAYQPVVALNCYGCWCHRRQYFGGAKGKPVDEFDGICRQLTHNYECMAIDASEIRDETCDPNVVQDVGYKHTFDIVQYPDNSYDMKISCNTHQSWCQQRTCEADLQYLKQFIALSLEGKYANFNKFGLVTHGGNFDNQKNCGLKSKVRMPVKKCCGQYPKRKLFKTDKDGGFRACCSLTDETDIEDGLTTNDGQYPGRVYRPEKQVCCGSFGVQDGQKCNYYG